METTVIRAKVGHDYISGLEIPTYTAAEVETLYGTAALDRLVMYGAAELAHERVRDAAKAAQAVGADPVQAGRDALVNFDFTPAEATEKTAADGGRKSKVQAILAKAADMDKDALVAELQRLADEQRQAGQKAAAARQDRKAEASAAE